MFAQQSQQEIKVSVKVVNKRLTFRFNMYGGRGKGADIQMEFISGFEPFHFSI